MQKYTQQIMIYDPLMFLCLCQFFSPLFLIFWNFCFALLSLQLFNGFLPFLFTHSDKQQTHNTLSCCLTGLLQCHFGLDNVPPTTELLGLTGADFSQARINVHCANINEMIITVHNKRLTRWLHHCMPVPPTSLLTHPVLVYLLANWTASGGHVATARKIIHSEVY